MKGRYEEAFYILLSLLTVISILYMKKIDDYNEIKVWAKAVEQTYNENYKELDKKLHVSDAELLQLQDKYYEEKLINLLDKDKLTSIAKEKWKYSLYVNNMPLKDNQVYVNSKNIAIILEEKLVGDRNLPSKIEEWGTLTGGDKCDKFYDHLSIKTKFPYDRNIKVERDGKSTTVYYTFKDIPRGTIITIKLSEVLRERLNIMNNTLEIII